MIVAFPSVAIPISSIDRAGTPPTGNVVVHTAERSAHAKIVLHVGTIIIWSFSHLSVLERHCISKVLHYSDLSFILRRRVSGTSNNSGTDETALVEVFLLTKVLVDSLSDFISANQLIIMFDRPGFDKSHSGSSPCTLLHKIGSDCLKNESNDCVLTQLL